MVLVWNDAKSFQGHLEAMRAFRQSHSAFPVNGRLPGDMPTPYTIDFSHGERLVIYLATSTGNIIFIPIWKVTEPKNSQN